MRTTISLEEGVLRAAKRRARRLGLTLGQLVEAALRRELARPPREPTEKPAIPVFERGTGLRPGVDATSTAALLEALDGDRPIEQMR